MSEEKKRKVLEAFDMRVVNLFFEGSMHRILTKMYLKKAFDYSTATSLEYLSQEENQTLPDLQAGGYIGQTSEGKFYLTKRGMSIGSSGIDKLFREGYDPFKKGYTMVPWEELDPELKKQAMETEFRCLLCGGTFTGLGLDHKCGEQKEET